MSLSDIHVGYFLRGVQALAPRPGRYDVLKIIGALSGAVVILGSSGGGDLFAFRRAEQDVLLLPAGLILDGTYHNADGRARLVAATFTEFLQTLAADVRAFVKNIPGHRFIVHD